MTHTAKRTPGPWVVRNMSDAMAEKFTVERLTNDGLRSVICRINDMEVCPEHGGTGSEANAHLIAAAPAMYEALVETMRVLRSLRDNKEEWYTLVTPELLTAWDKNKAALAQAEGTNRGTNILIYRCLAVFIMLVR